MCYVLARLPVPLSRQHACRLYRSEYTYMRDMYVLCEHRRDRSTEREAEDAHLRELYERVAKAPPSSWRFLLVLCFSVTRC